MEFFNEFSAEFGSTPLGQQYPPPYEGIARYVNSCSTEFSPLVVGGLEPFIKMPIPTKREVAVQLRYQYLRYREIDRAIHALERLQRIREEDPLGGKLLRKKPGTAA